MASLIPGYTYDIFISYRQKDNKYDGWVTEFVNNLKKELEATFKEEISVYFDINPCDYLLETYDVDASLKGKMKCLVFIPIISRTYCDPKSFSWEHEFKAFIGQASQDQFGLKMKLSNGNVASRVLPIQIHEITTDDKMHIEEALGGILRPVEFIYKEPGVNRPLRSSEDHPDNNLNKTFYRNQINKVANAIDEIINSLKNVQAMPLEEKTKKQEPLEEAGKEPERGAWIRPAKSTRLKFLSGITILSIVIIALVIVYPKISENRSSLYSMTSPVTVINENGEKEVRRIFKDSYVIRLAIFPFMNESNDSSDNWLQYGFPDAICQDLYQFSYVTIRVNTDVRHLQEQIKDARANNYPFFLTGSYRVEDGKYEITSRLYKTKNGTVASERIYRGNDFFSIIDSISLQTRVDLGISNDVINSSPDLPFMEHSTSNLDAFRYYIKGFYIDSLSTNLRKSIETDSTFAVALYYSASDNYNFQICHESALRDINQAIRHRKRLIEADDIWTRVLYYSILGEYDKAITLSEMQHELQPGNFLILKDLIFAYASNLMIDKYEKAARQLTELVPNDPEYMIDLSYSYLHSGKLNQGLEVLEKLLESSSEDVNALLLAGEIYLHKNDLVNAERMFQKAILSQPENEKDWSKMYDYIEYSRNNPVNDEFLKLFTGSYRFDEGEMSFSFFIHNNHLTGKAKNQYPVFSYPVSDSKFLSLNGTASFTFARNNQGEVIKTTLYQNDTYSVAWKEDSLIIEALDLLNKGEKAEALSAFREAYDSNPDHYYLADFIRYLEFIHSDRYEIMKPVLETCVGKYGDINVFKRNDMLYYEDKRGYFYKILPLSEDRFMMPSSYNRQIQILKKNYSIEGLKFIYRDGKEEFFSRNN